jgi:hypothetical protein
LVSSTNQFGLVPERRRDCMGQVLDDGWQQHVASSIAHWSEMAKAAIEAAASIHARPSAVFRPKLTIDGNQWCALYGENLQDGVAGFGASPVDAMWDFDRAWNAKLPNTEVNRDER